jgi:solute carrier family 13 (sodium-dependent dicarboxylate transporter), member 2/3/5
MTSISASAESSAAKPSAMTFQRWMDFLGIPVAVLVFLALYLMPTPSGLSVNAQSALAIFIAALVLWVSQSIPVYATALVAMLLLILTGARSEAQVEGMLGQDVIWLMVCAFVLTSAMSKAGLARRIALAMVASFSSRAKWALLSMAILNGILAFLVPSTTARAALLLPIVVILAEVYGAVPGKSRFGASMMIQEVQMNSIFTSGIMTATAANVMAVGFIRTLGGEQVYYSDWLFASFPIAVISVMAAWAIGLIFYPPEHDSPMGQGLDKLRGELRKMGPMSADEWRAAFIFALTVFLWVTDRWHVGWWGFTVSTTAAAIIGATLCFLPGIGLLTWKETKIPWDLMIFSAGAYAVGLALEGTGGAKWLLDTVFNAAGIKSMSFFSAYALVMVIAMFSHFIFTSKTVRTAIVIPIVIALAKSMGFSPLALALPAAFTMTWTITLPPHSKPNLIFYGTGYFTVLQMLVYGVAVCAIGVALLIAAGPTWFAVLGITR